MTTAPTPHRMTVEEYLAMDRASTDVRYEYHNGRVSAKADETSRHDTIRGYTIAALCDTMHDQSWRVYGPDVRVQVAPTRYVYPDVTISHSFVDRSNPVGILSPSVVGEVLSPTTIVADRGDRFHHYRACPSIQEHILIDSERPEVQLFRRNVGYWDVRWFGRDDILDLTSIGVQIPVAALYRDIDFPSDEEDL